MYLSLEELLKKNDEPIIILESREREIDLLIKDQIVDNEIIIRIIKGKDCKNNKELFLAISSALQFPYYFGNNWNALDECLLDLSWLKFEKFVLIITSYDLLLMNESIEEKTIFFKILKEASKYWNSKSFFKIIFQTTSISYNRFNKDIPVKKLCKYDSIK